MEQLSSIKALMFDVFGTILDLGGSLTPFINEFLTKKGANVSPERFWERWRYRQRIEQYQDNILMLGHSGYLETSRRGLVYVLRLNGIEASTEEVKGLMAAWQELSPFPEVLPALERLKARYRLVVLSNGEPQYLHHVVKNRIRFDFHEVISVHVVGAFKPHPGVYRRGAAIMGLEVGECLMVSANTYDMVGSRACGYRAAFVNRYGLPDEDSPYRPDITVKDFKELADGLL